MPQIAFPVPEKVHVLTFPVHPYQFEEFWKGRRVSTTAYCYHTFTEIFQGQMSPATPESIIIWLMSACVLNHSELAKAWELSVRVLKKLQTLKSINIQHSETAFFFSPNAYNEAEVVSLQICKTIFQNIPSSGDTKGAIKCPGNLRELMQLWEVLVFPALAGSGAQLHHFYIHSGTKIVGLEILFTAVTKIDEWISTICRGFSNACVSPVENAKIIEEKCLFLTPVLFGRSQILHCQTSNTLSVCQCQYNNICKHSDFRERGRKISQQVKQRGDFCKTTPFLCAKISKAIHFSFCFGWALKPFSPISHWEE